MDAKESKEPVELDPTEEDVSAENVVDAEAAAEEADEVAPEAAAGEADEVVPEAAAEDGDEVAPENAAEEEAGEIAAEETPDVPTTKAAKKKNGAPQPSTESGEESTLPMKWYVIHTYSGHENKVKENIIKMIATSSIQDQFGRLIVPTEEVAEMKKGKKTITTRKFFPSYILIEMFMSDESWHLVNGIPGVTSFVGTATKPQPLLPNEVERILGRMDKDKETIIPEIPYTLGEHIRIKDGPFSDFTGVIDEINAEKGKLRVLVSIFGRETPVELDFLQVESL